jgi:hypothetical protein
MGMTLTLWKDASALLGGQLLGTNCSGYKKAAAVMRSSKGKIKVPLTLTARTEGLLH